MEKLATLGILKSNDPKNYSYFATLIPIISDLQKINAILKRKFEAFKNGAAAAAVTSQL